LKATKRFNGTGDVWLGAKLVMFAPFTWKGYSIHSALFVMSTLVAFMQRKKGKITRKEFNHIAFSGIFGIAGGIMGAGIGGGIGFGIGLKCSLIFGSYEESKWFQLVFAIIGTCCGAIPGSKGGRYYFKRMYAWLENVLF
jgi:hypothetical protein